MSYSARNEAICSKPQSVAHRAEDGYFGWTDRYGVRPSFFPESRAINSGRAPYFIANY